MSEIIKMETRFGVMEFDTGRTLFFPEGILGFPELHHYGLSLFHNQRLPGAMVLQSLDETSLSFLVVSLRKNSGIYKDNDLLETSTFLNLNPEHMELLGIVGMHGKDSDRPGSLSVNLRAPVFVDVKKQKAWQQVLASDTYPIRYYIDEEKEILKAG